MQSTPPSPPAFEVLSPVDAQLWHWDTPETPMMMGNVCLFEGKPFFDEAGNFRLDDVRRAIESRLHLVRRYRQRVVEVPLGRPILIDDPTFDIVNHVNVITLPAPGAEDQLKAAFASVHEGLLDRSRPLWKMVFIQGLADGRVGLVQKIHHAPFDGATTVRIMEALFDEESTPGPATPTLPYSPQQPPTAVAVAANNVLLGLTAALRLGAGPLRRGFSPRSVIHTLREVAAVRQFLPAPRTSLNRPVGPKRRFDWVHTTLDDVRRARSLVEGATLNDVMLTAVAGGLRELFLARGEDITAIRPRVFVPVDVRGDAREQVGNVFSALVLHLPLDEPDGGARLLAISREMAALKVGPQAGAMNRVMRSAELVPPLVQAMSTWQQHNRPMFMNLTVTNVPGPRRDLCFLGARMLELNPMLPLGNQTGLNVAVESYGDRLSIGLCSDPTIVPELDVFTQGLRSALDDLIARPGR